MVLGSDSRPQLEAGAMGSFDDLVGSSSQNGKNEKVNLSLMDLVFTGVEAFLN